jgi:hypothetical protein
VTVNGGLASGFTGMKNRIINGGMVIDQRNNGASVNLTSNGYLIDRWAYYVDQTSKATAQQSSTTATGFRNSLLITSSSAYSVLSGDQFIIQQFIEGLNVSDLGWGTANAQTVTLSFWVRSSLTGTFGGSIVNSGQNRSYPFTYTISAANTFEYKTITIAGDTSGTWLTTNGIGIRVYFGLGVGTTNSGTAGAWAGTYYSSATGATSVVGTNGATWYVTGVQLERGSNATSFEFRDYGRELIMCQRYLPAFNGTSNYFSSQAVSTTVTYTQVTFPVSTRVAPTGISTSTVSGANFLTYSNIGNGLNTTAITFILASTNSALITTTVASGLTAGNASSFLINAVSGQILFTGCEL